ncbi:MAG TPA: helix-turn-helix domain-containing protein [Nitriliruptorales bacterium]
MADKGLTEGSVSLVETELDALVEGLATRLGRSVVIGDRRFQLRAHSSAVDPFDGARTSSILERRVPPEVVEWVRRHGVEDAVAPMHVPANPGLDLHARVCIPIRTQDVLLGWLWLMDPEGTLSPEEIGMASSVAASAGQTMYRRQLHREMESARRHVLLRDLLTDSAELSQDAADALIDGNLFVGGTMVVAFVVTLSVAGNSHLMDPDRFGLDLALDAACRSLVHRRALHLVRPRHGLVVAAVQDESLTHRIQGFGERMLTEVRRTLGDGGTRDVRVGIGSVVPSLAEAARSYGRACEAVDVGQVVAGLGPVVAWNRLGVFRTLSRFPREEITEDVLHPALLRLASDRGEQVLLDTLEAYLDAGCDAAATADRLGLHRASVYSRLKRIEAVAQVDLRSGADRLALHLGLKLARLASLDWHQVART